MTYGNFYVGKNGFAYKKSGGGGANRVPSLYFGNNQSKNIFNRYVPGSGVGASSYATRRFKNARATECISSSVCKPDFYYLGYPI
jgi:hypothetical protein